MEIPVKTRERRFLQDDARWTHSSRIVVVLLLLLVSVPARANVIYTYTGNPFTDVLDLPFPPGTFDTSMRVTGWFELADPLPADLPLTDIGGDVLAFSFSNGRGTLTDADPNLSTFFFVRTDAAGDIDVWDLIFDQSLTLTPFGDRDTKIVTQNDPAGLLFGVPGVQDRGGLLMCDPLNVPRGLCISFEDSALIDGSPGVWGSSSPPTVVPEPAALALVLAGIAASVRSMRARLGRLRRPRAERFHADQEISRFRDLCRGAVAAFFVDVAGH